MLNIRMTKVGSDLANGFSTSVHPVKHRSLGPTSRISNSAGIGISNTVLSDTDSVGLRHCLELNRLVECSLRSPYFRA